jgi:periplasmic protein TonB
MFSRYASAVSSGTVVTLGLFYLMQLLITMPATLEAAQRVHGTLAWTPVPPPPAPPLTDPIPDKTFVEPPLPPTTRPTAGGDDYTPVAPYPQPAPRPLQHEFNVVPDGPLVVVMHVEPTYPGPALAQGLEGTVLVESDVSASGSVTAVRVVESSDRVFERAALDAAKRFRYKPRVVDGVPQPVSGVRYLFRFEMSD